MNQKQKRALRKKRHARQQCLKYTAPLLRLEHALMQLNTACTATKDGVRCRVEGAHNVHRGLNANGLAVVWRDRERA